MVLSGVTALGIITPIGGIGFYDWLDNARDVILIIFSLFLAEFSAKFSLT